MTRNRPLHYVKNLAHDKATGRYHVLKKINGRQIKRSFPTKRSAMMFLEHVVLQAAGVYLAEMVPTLAEAFDSYIAELKRLNRSQHTINYYGLRRKSLESIIGDVPLDRITQAAVNDYIDARSAHVGAGTINKEITALKTIYTAAGITPSWRLKSLSHRPKRKRVQPPSVVRKLWQALTPATRCAVGLCLFAGFRAEEVWRADASWIHGDEIDCEMEKSDGDTNRTWLVGTLRGVLPKRGKLVKKTEAAIRYELEERSKDLGITPPYLGPGAFRGHCSTYAADLGFSRDEIKLVLGHQFGDVTDRYIHSQQIEKKKKVLEAVEKRVLGSHQVVTPNDSKRGNNDVVDNVVDFREAGGK